MHWFLQRFEGVKASQLQKSVWQTKVFRGDDERQCGEDIDYDNNYYF